MKKTNKILTLVLTLIVCMSLLAVTVWAEAAQEELKLTLATDKASYAVGEQVLVTLKAENVSQNALNNVTLKITAPKGLTLVTGEEQKTLDTLAANTEQTVNVAYKAEASSAAGTGDSTNIVLAAVLTAVSAVAAVLLFANRRSRCMAMALLMVVGIAAVGVPAKAAGETYSTSVSTTIEVEGEKVTLKAVASWEAETAGDPYEGYTLVGSFGNKSEFFADSTLRLKRTEDGILFDFVGTRKLTGQIELYINTKDCAANRDVDATCWRLDLTDGGTIGGTHFAGGALVTEGLVYELLSNDDNGYHATLFVPYTYLDITKTEVFGISLGQWSTAASDWDGWAFEDQFVAPETPATYILVDADGKAYRGTMPDGNEDPDNSYEGYTEVGNFGNKSELFANSTLRLKRTEDGILFDFVGTRKLTGQIELYLDTKECAAHRDSDATCWRLDLTDGGTIGGTHFAGGALVTDGLVYNLLSNGDDGYHATLFVPYSYLDITETEVFGISLGQWSTAANDWDGWGFEGQFVAPETPATYIRVGADGQLYRKDSNTAQ